MAEKRKNVITIDPEMQYTRMLHYKEKHSGWMIFNSVYWGVFVFVIGMLLLANLTVTLSLFLGWAFVIFAIFFIVYGFAGSLHLKLMKTHA